MVKTDTGVKMGLLDRLGQDVVVCAEGYLFECERRGYLQAGAYVPVSYTHLTLPTKA